MSTTWSRLLFVVYAIIMTIPCILSGMDNAHFYRASYFFGETRLDCPWLFSGDATIAGGATSTSRTNNGTSVPLLDIYGIHDMRTLAQGIPSLDPTNPLDLALILLADLPECSSFGQLSFQGDFEITEANLSITQNFKRGFFAQIHLPIRKIGIHGIKYTDLSPDDSACQNKNRPEWQVFLNAFSDILQRYQIDTSSIHKSGIGDLSLLGGWTINYNETEWLDYIDGTIRAGILLPTGKKRNENHMCDLPLGYNGHFAGSLSLAGAAGLYEWLTLGAYIDMLFFRSDTKTMHIKTSYAQSGLIKLAQAKVNVQAGTLFTTGAYVKADHFCRGLSLLFGYSYSQKDADIVTLDPFYTCFNAEIINSDESLHGWNNHTLHFMLEMDFTQYCSRWGSRLGLFYNRTIAGKRIFNTQNIGASCGLELAFDY